MGRLPLVEQAMWDALIIEGLEDRVGVPEY